MEKRRGEMMKNGIDLPTTTVHQSRLQIFQPTRRPSKISEKFETAWGSLKIDGNLGQAHADILESIMVNHIGKRNLDDGRLQILVDPYQLRKAVGGYGHDKLWKRLRELKSAILELYISSVNEKYLCSILDEIAETNSRIKRDPRSHALRKNDVDDDLAGRKKWKFTFSMKWTSFIEKDIQKFYDPAPIVGLRHGISQSIARFILSHKSQPNGGWKLETLFGAVGAKGRARDRKSELISDSDGLARIGIKIENDRVLRESATICPIIDHKRDHMPGGRDHMPDN